MTHVGCSVQLGPRAQEHPVPSPAKAPRSPHEAPMSPSAPTMDPWGGRSPLPMAVPCPPYPSLPTCWLQARPTQGCPRISLKRHVREPPLCCAGTRLLSRENVPSPRGQLAAAATGPRPPVPTLRRPRLPARAARTRAGRATGRSRAQGEHLRVSRRDGRAPGQHRALAFGSY